MNNIKTKVRRILSFILAGVLVSGVAYAAISNKVFMKGATFTTTNIEIKFIKDNTNNTDVSNLVSEIQGVSFDNIYNYWTQDYPVKILNTSSNTLKIVSYANYTTAEDPANLRYSLFVEVFDWNDENNDGQLTDNEIGKSYGKKNFVKWKTEGFDLGELGVIAIRPLVLRFSAENLTESKIGQTGRFDFEFGVMQ